MKIKVTSKEIQVTGLDKDHFPGLLTALSIFDVKIEINQLSVCSKNENEHIIKHQQQKIIDFLIAYCKIKEWEYEIGKNPNYNECTKELSAVLKKYKLNLLPNSIGDELGLTLSPTDNCVDGKYLCSWLLGNQ